MDASTLHTEIAKVCPIESASVGDGNDRATWAFIPLSEATQAQTNAGNNVIATLPVNFSPLVATDDWIARWTNAEYLALQKLRTTDNGKMSKTFDIVISRDGVDMNKQKTQTLKDELVAGGILTAARADEIFS